jgi:hypothetical protein
MMIKGMDWDRRRFVFVMLMENHSGTGTATATPIISAKSGITSERESQLASIALK